jgi:CRISPR-associated exonuclease Cas4
MQKADSDSRQGLQAFTPLLNVNDLKQFLYCPRIIYYTWVMPVHPPATYLMQRGHRMEEEFARLEPRRVLSRYGFEEAVRHFGMQVTDDALNLTGKIDLILENRDQVGVVEFKASASGLAENWKIQLCAYGLLAERHFQRPCPVGFALLSDKEELVEVELDDDLRQRVMQCLGGAQEVITKQGFPDRTPVRARCTQCEHRNFCGDVF